MQLNRTECSILIVGATFAGLGAALAALEENRDVVVVERTALVGREFIEAFRPGSEWTPPVTKLGQLFREALMQRGLMEEAGPAHLPALHPLLCSLVKENGLKVRFLTEIVDVTRRGDQYEVTLHDASGCGTLAADTIVDTTSQRLTSPGQPAVPGRKWIRAYLYNTDIRDAVLPEQIDEMMTVCRGRYRSEVILRVEAAPEDGWTEVRRRLFAYWQARPERWKPWTIAAVAGEFESDVPPGPHVQNDGLIWLPSEAYANPLNALDQGYDYYKKAVGQRDAATIE
ncbi:FAD-dependent oxidoreductase [Paenibacillus ginsengarvi]|uniref:FAD-dependent oxidoreductase n=1 Tax=Paenibacillus ginsengarvi TaxID=400777 RepID=UPI001315A42C|nr:FAD-dependent oxidoreductase [Paenibacillus ginsengarvi]